MKLHGGQDSFLAKKIPEDSGLTRISNKLEHHIIKKNGHNYDQSLKKGPKNQWPTSKSQKTIEQKKNYFDVVFAHYTNP